MQLPCQRRTSDPSITHRVQLLSPVYSSKLTSSLTQSYLTDLRGVAKLCSDYDRLLLDERKKNQKSARIEDGTPPDETLSVSSAVTPDQTLPLPINQAVSLPDNAASPAAAEKSAPLLSPEQINIPEVQRVIVEHIVKTSDLSQPYTSSPKFRPFSGKTPCPNMEVDFDTSNYITPYTTE